MLLAREATKTHEIWETLSKASELTCVFDRNTPLICCCLCFWFRGHVKKTVDDQCNRVTSHRHRAARAGTNQIMDLSHWLACLNSHIFIGCKSCRWNRIELFRVCGAHCPEMRSGNGVYFRENLIVLPIEILNCYIPIPSDLLGGTFWAYLNIEGDLYPPMYMAATPMVHNQSNLYNSKARLPH